jgi:hypothetical protein
MLGSPMATTDVDVCAPLDDENLRKIIEALRGLNPRWRARPGPPVLVDDAERFRGFKNLYIETDSGFIDVLGELPGVGTYSEIEDRTETIELGELKFRVLDIDTLIAAKRAAGRDKDLISIRHLEAVKNARNPGP